MDKKYQSAIFVLSSYFNYDALGKTFYGVANRTSHTVLQTLVDDMIEQKKSGFVMVSSRTGNTCDFLPVCVSETVMTFESFEGYKVVIFRTA